MSLQAPSKITDNKKRFDNFADGKVFTGKKTKCKWK